MWRYLGISVVLLLSVVVYWPTLQSDYVAYDDELLIVDNVKAQGLTWEHVRQAFTTYDPELYIPLTLLTEQIEYSIVGGWNPAVSHGISLVLHLLNVLLVFWLMRLLIAHSSYLTAILVALLFAIHPLNVEAVAWAAARKDLLSTFFFLLSLCWYLKWRGGVTLSACLPVGKVVEVRHAVGPSTTLGMTHCWRNYRYWLSLVAFLLGLLSKVSIAPLPLVLLLLEGFLPSHPLPFKGEGRARVLKRVSPYFLLSIIFVFVALLGKKDQVHALGVTLLAPFVAIPFYLRKLFIPTGLSILYPFTEELSLMHPSVLLGIAVVSGLTWLSWWSLRWTRSVTCAFSIFLVLLIPSFLNVARRGDAGMIDLVVASDRYMYLAMLGPLLLVGCLLCGRNSLSPRGEPACRQAGVRVRGLPYGILGSFLLFFVFLSSRQVRVWHDSEALFRNVLLQHQASHIAANNLAGLLAKKGQMAEAMELYRQSLTIRENPRALFNMGRLLLSEKHFSEALPLFERYVAMKPRDAFGQMQLGGLYLLQNNVGQARPHLQQAVTRDPNLTEAHYLLGVTFERLGDHAAARREFQETLRLEPNHPHARGKLD